jgi:hypothetical protein
MENIERPAALPVERSMPPVKLPIVSIFVEHMVAVPV